LLAEQNVPVFCQINALEINPLIDIKQIKNIGFSGSYPKEIVGAGFHPARAALKTRDILLGDPLINNIGYIVVVLKKNENESSLPSFVNTTLRATLQYETGNAYGIGRTEFLLRAVGDTEWNNDEKLKNSFWNGRYFVRLEQVDSDYAFVSLYNGDKKVTTVKVKRGETSKTFYMPGLYCRAGIQVNYRSYEGAKDKARLEIGSGLGTDSFDVYKGSTFLNGKCNVRDISVDNQTLNTGNITIRCSSGEEVRLSIGARVVTEKKTKDADGNKVETKVELSDGKLYSDDAEIAFNDAIAEYKRVASEYGA